VVSLVTVVYLVKRTRADRQRELALLVQHSDQLTDFAKELARQAAVVDRKASRIRGEIAKSKRTLTPIRRSRCS
jgi:hypothetical protein